MVMQGKDPKVVAPPTVQTTFAECDSRAPGLVCVNVSRVLYITPDRDDLAVLHFEDGQVLLLSDTYEAVKTAFTGLP